MKVLGLVVLAACELVQTQSTSRTSPATSSASAPPPDRASGGRDEVTIPDVAHQSLEQAKQALRAAGVTGEITVENVDTDDAAPEVCATSPGAGQHTLGHFQVTLTACELELPGYATPPGTPELRGLTVEEAKRKIDEAMPEPEYHNEVVVKPLVSKHYKCQLDRVCRVNPVHWVTYRAPIELFVLRAH